MSTGGGEDTARGGRGSLWRTVKAVAWGFFGVRTTSTGQGAYCWTRCAVLPSRTVSLIPREPLATTMRSAPSSFATRTISAAGEPLRTRPSTLAAPAPSRPSRRRGPPGPAKRGWWR